ncbi:MAG TPA: 4'-phosphopantetheinyl transferase superfamily protein [Gemmatimonadales bacterium]
MADTVGLDLEELDALARFGARARVLPARWLGAAERSWCGRQPEPLRAFVVVWSCREAAFKAAGVGGSPHGLRLRLSGTIARGRARACRARRVVAEVAWRRRGRYVVAVAVGGGIGSRMLARRLVSLIAEEDLDADSGHGRHGIYRHGPGAAAS